MLRGRKLEQATNETNRQLKQATNETDRQLKQATNETDRQRLPGQTFELNVVQQMQTDLHHCCRMISGCSSLLSRL